METEADVELPCFNILVCSKPNLVSSVYRKPTNRFVDKLF